MTRGKHGHSASVRRDVSAIAVSEDAYRRQVAKLSAEVRDLRASLEAERRDRATERRTLRAQLDEGISPEINAREAIINDLTRKLGYSQGLRKVLDSKFKTVLRLYIRHLREVHGMSAWDAVTELAKEGSMNHDAIAREGMAIASDRIESLAELATMHYAAKR